MRAARAFLIAALAASCAWASAEELIYLRLAEIHPEDFPTVKGDLEFARLVKERSGGRIEIVVYPGAALGQERAVLEQVKFGAIDLARVSLSAVAGYEPELDALQMPYLYRDNAHMWKVLKGEIGAELLGGLEKSGFIGLGWFESGSRNFYTVKGPVRSPGDLRGLRIRVQESELMLAMVKAFGAIPVPMAYGDVYSALLTEAVDGAENNWPSYYSWNHHRLARFITLDGHTSVPEIIVGSKLSLDLLAPADRRLMAECAARAVDYQRSEWAAYEKLAMDGANAAGVVITPVADKAAWRALMEPLYARQSPSVRELVRRVKALK
jgi:tripartite ATP-independent transporter DctP family solute receptor